MILAQKQLQLLKTTATEVIKMLIYVLTTRKCSPPGNTWLCQFMYCTYQKEMSTSW